MKLEPGVCAISNLSSLECTELQELECTAPVAGADAGADPGTVGSSRIRKALVQSARSGIYQRLQ